MEISSQWHESREVDLARDWREEASPRGYEDDESLLVLAEDRIDRSGTRCIGRRPLRMYAALSRRFILLSANSLDGDKLPVVVDCWARHVLSRRIR